MAKEFLFSLPGITCSECVRGLKNELESLQAQPGNDFHILSHAIDLSAKQILITVQTDLSNAAISLKLKELIEDVGVDCQEIEKIQPESEIDLEKGEQQPLIPKKTTQTNSLFSHLVRGIGGLAFGFGLMILTWTGLALPASLMYTLIVLSSFATIALGMDSYIDASKKFIKSRTLTMDALFTISSITAIAVSIVHIFLPWLPMMMEAGLLIFGFRHIGRAIEDSINQRVTKQLTFKEKAPKRIEKEITREQYEITLVSMLQPNTIIRVKAGQTIPVDGICLDESTSIYKTIVTGHTLPASLKQGEEILAGMVVPEDVPLLRMQVVRRASESLLEKKDRAVLRANEKKAPIELIADRILQYFVPGVILLAIGTSIGVGFLFNPTLAIQWGTSLVVSACPCTFGFLIALAVKNGMAESLKNGVNFKTSHELQTGSSIKIVALDLNGTLTTGVPTVTKHCVYFDKGITAQQFCNYINEIEKNSRHPFAKAICAYLQKSVTLDLDCEVSDIDLTHRSGIKAKINHDYYLVGNKQLLQDHQIAVDKIADEPSPIEHVIYFARERDKTLLGYIKIQDPLRDDAALTVKGLQAQGKEVVMCTGTDKDTALRYASLLGIPEKNVYAACVDKLSIVAELKKRGETTMVGDASNDVEAVTGSTLGIAIKSHSGCEITQDRAGAIIENPNLMSLVTTFAIANATASNIKQNLIISIAYNVLMFVVAGGLLLYKNITIPAGIAAGLMVAQTCLILLNQYRISRAGYTPPTVPMNTVSSVVPHTYQLLHRNGIGPTTPSVRLQEDTVDVELGLKSVVANYLPEASATQRDMGVQESDLEMARVSRL